MIVVIDNYDSFTYNLVQYLGQLGAEVQVYRNDEIGLDQIEALKPSAILVSPGPGRPESAGISCDVMETFSGRIPLLGVCLGHQCLGQVSGARVILAAELMHGKTCPIRHDGRGLFRGLPEELIATRYHSLSVSKEGLPDFLEVTATSPDGEIMGLRRRAAPGEAPTEGVQFHPESILTESGLTMLRNFMEMRSSMT